MIKNVAGQKIGCQMVSATDGSAFTGSVTVAVTGDAGTQATGSVGSGACTHEGNGYHTYAPAQAETNYELIAFTFTGTGAVPATVQAFTHANVTHYNGTAATSVAGRPQVEAYNPKVWYVDATNGSDSNDGKSWTTAKQTNSFISGSTATGDKIYFADGSYTYSSSPKAGQTWIGTGRACIQTRNQLLGGAVTLNANNVTLRNMKFVNTNSSGMGLLTSGTIHGVRLEDLWVVGPYDGGRLDGFDDGVIRNCVFESDYDALVVNGKGWLVENCTGITTASKAAARMGCFRTSLDSASTATGQTGTLRNFVGIIERTATDASTESIGIEIDGKSRVRVEGAMLWLTSATGGDTGTVTGVSLRDTAEGTIDRVHIHTAHAANSALAKDLKQADTSTLKINTAAARFDSTKTTGTITAVLPNVAPAANGGLPTADASNQVLVAATSVRTALGMAAADLDTQLDTITAATPAPISPERISDERTWFADGYRARNIVEVGDNFVGTLALAPDLNPDQTITAVTAVSITGAATVTATDLETTADRRRANFTVPALTTTGTYTVVVTCTTTDGQTIPTTATLKVN